MFRNGHQKGNFHIAEKQDLDDARLKWTIINSNQHTNLSSMQTQVLCP